MRERVTSKIELSGKVQDPGAPAVRAIGRGKECTLEVPNFLRDRQELACGQRAVADEHGGADAAERLVSEDVNVLELHTRIVACISMSHQST